MTDEIRVTINGKALEHFEATADRLADAVRAKQRDDRLREADKLGEHPLKKFARVWGIAALALAVAAVGLYSVAQADAAINRRQVRSMARNIGKHKCYHEAITTDSGIGWYCKRRYSDLSSGWGAGDCRFGPPLASNIGICTPYAHLHARLQVPLGRHDRIWLDFTTAPNGGVWLIQHGATIFIAPIRWAISIHGEIARMGL